MIIAKIKEEDKFREKKLLNQSKSNNNITTSYSNSNLIDKSPSLSKINKAKSSEMPDLINIESYLDKEKKVSVYCTAVANPHAFWVQISSESNDSLKKFNNQMNQFYSNNSSTDLMFVSILKSKLIISF